MNNYNFQLQANQRSFINGGYGPGSNQNSNQPPNLTANPNFEQHLHQPAPPPQQQHQFIQHQQQSAPFYYENQQQHMATPVHKAPQVAQTISPMAQDAADSTLMQSRIAILLDTNLELIEHAVKAPKDNHHHPDSLYVACMKRLQCNLAYLASLADKAKSIGVVPAFPQILTAPGEIPSLQYNYEQLRALFPEANIPK